MLRLLKLLTLVAVLLLGIALHARNGQAVEFDYYLGQVRASLALMLAVALLAGALAGVLATLPRMLSLRRRLGRLQRLEREREALAALDKAAPPAAGEAESRTAAGSP